MTTKTSSNSSVLIIILLIITFPIWIGIIGGLFGLIVGLFGAFIGVIGAVFGAIFGAIGAVLGAFDWFSFPIHGSGIQFFLIVAIIFAVVMMSRSKKKN